MNTLTKLTDEDLTAAEAWVSHARSYPTPADTHTLRNWLALMTREVRAFRVNVGQRWQPIASAPKDGTEVWAFNGEQARMRWIEGGEDMPYALWVWADDVLCEVDPSPDQPTHFMPLPANPGA